GALIAISRIIIIYTRTSASIKRIKEVYSTQNTITDPKRPANLDMSAGASVEFKNVSFSYGDAKDVVKKLSLKVEPGQTIGIIGGTGSGKSSIVNLIPRFYDATKGKVLINGMDIKRYKVEDLRAKIGIVPQNPTLFKGTLRQNMRWHKATATDEEIIRALIIAQAYEFVKAMPDFLDSKVERGGTNFSGGQRQRLTIARALVNNPSILILDDSSSALDFATDAALRRSIRRYLANVTTFIVSQRANTIRNADQIVVLDNGNVVGIGTNDELLATCDVYREIFNSQNKPEEAK
ncbi:MAG: ABC transporter ATP-binding protein, partial [Clostridia bacterium]